MLLGEWLAMKLDQGLIPMRKTHELFGLWSKMKMQQSLRPTRKRQLLLGERPAMRPHRAQPGLWTCVGRPRAKRRHTSLRMIRLRPYASTDVLLRNTA